MLTNENQLIFIKISADVDKEFSIIFKIEVLKFLSLNYILLTKFVFIFFDD